MSALPKGEIPPPVTVADVTPKLPFSVGSKVAAASLLVSAVFLGVSLGMAGGQGDDTFDALRWQLALFWTPMGLLHGLRHLLAHGTMTPAAFFIPSPAFEAEVAGANLSFGIMSLVAYCQEWPPQAGAAIIFAYCIYLFFAMLVHTWKLVFLIRHGDAKAQHIALGLLMLFFFAGVIAVGITFGARALLTPQRPWPMHLLP